MSQADSTRGWPGLVIVIEIQTWVSWGLPRISPYERSNEDRTKQRKKLVAKVSARQKRSPKARTALQGCLRRGTRQGPSVFQYGLPSGRTRPGTVFN